MADYGDEEQTADGHRGSIHPDAMADFIQNKYDAFIEVFDELDEEARNELIANIKAIDEDDTSLEEFAHKTFGGSDEHEQCCIGSQDSWGLIVKGKHSEKVIDAIDAVKALKEFIIENK